MTIFQLSLQKAFIFPTFKPTIPNPNVISEQPIRKHKNLVEKLKRNELNLAQTLGPKRLNKFDDQPLETILESYFKIIALTIISVSSHFILYSLNKKKSF